MGYHVAYYWAGLSTGVLLCSLVTAQVNAPLEPAGQVHKRAIGLAEGLPSLTVYDLLLDKAGVLWVGTEDGLARFDGYRFTQIESPNAQASPTDDLQLDSAGRVWYANFSGQVFFVEGDTAHIAVGHPETPWQAKKYALDSEGALWWVQENGIYYRPNNRGLRPKKLADKAPKRFSFLLQEKKQIWLYTGENTLGKFTFSSRRYPVSNGYTVREVTGVTRLFAVPGGVWLTPATGNYNRLWVGNANSTAFRTIVLQIPPSAELIQVCVNPDSTLWCCTRKGAYLLHLDGSRVAGTPPLLPELAVTDVQALPQGALMVGTLEKGLFLLPDPRIQAYDGETFEGAISIAPLGNGLLGVGLTSGHIALLNTRTQQLRDVPISARPVEAFYWDKKTQQLFTNQLAFGLTSGHRRTAPHLSGKAFAVLGDSLYVGRHFGLVKFPLQQLNNNPPEESMNVSGRIRCLAADTLRKRLFVGSEYGLVRISTAGRDTFFVPKTKRPLTARELALTANGEVWVATTQAELFNITELKVRALAPHPMGTVRAMAASGNRLAIACDDGLWLRTANGGWHRKSRTAIALDTRAVTALCWVGDTLWLASHYGVFAIPEAVVLAPPQKPSVLLRYNGTLHTTGQRRLRLPPSQRTVVAELGIVGGYPVQRLQYRLLPVDTLWREVETRPPQLTLSNLAKGRYILQARAENGPNTQLAFECLPNWWETWGFRLAVLGLLVGTVVAVAHRRIRRIQRVSSLQVAARASELQALRAQMNPHFFFNSLNTLQAAILAQKTQEANRLLGQFAKLMRFVLDASRVGQVAVEQEVRGLEMYLQLQQARFGPRLEVVLQIEDSLRHGQFQIPALMVQPFVENALDHGLLHKTEGPQRLTVRFEANAPKPSHVQVTIADNGIGRAAAAEIYARQGGRKSFGLYSIQRRIELYEALYPESVGLEITDQTSPAGSPAGTTVYLTLPVLRSVGQ